MTLLTARDLLVSLVRRGPFLPLVAGAVGLLAVATVAGGREEPTQLDAARRLLTGFGLGIWLPLVALAIGSAVLGSWRDDGSGAHLWTRPVRRGSLTLLGWGTATTATICVAVVPLVVAVVIAGGGAELGAGAAAAGLGAAAAYTALFGWLALASRHAVELGLAYVLVWEGFVAKASDAAAALSIRSNALVSVERAIGISLQDAAPRGSAGVILVVCVVAGVTLTWNAVRGGALVRRA